jgi:FKBP-type peptidyl-prolyl cis-trans isomerase
MTDKPDEKRRWTRIASGIRGEDLSLGDGAVAERGRCVLISWRCTLNRGDEVNTGTVWFRIGARTVIAGLERGVIGMRVGGRRRLRISPHLAYRDQAVTGIPPNAVLDFDVKLLALSD